jgi:dolichol-phosphate mannosyltransferase
MLAVALLPWPDGLDLRVRSGLLWVNGIFLAIRLGMLSATRHAYVVRDIAFWTSPLADAAAALRITLSSLKRPRGWRGRDYAIVTPTP